MKMYRPGFTCVFLLALILSACQSATPTATDTLPPPPLASPTVAATTIPPTIAATSLPPTVTQPAATAAAGSSSIRACDYLPGKSVPAQIPAASAQVAASPMPTPLTFSPSPVDQTTLTTQTGIFNQIVKDISDHYYAADFNGADWKAIQAKYQNLIQKGLKQADFYQAMNQMVSELGDGSSVYLSPSNQSTQAGTSAGMAGMGGTYDKFTDQGKDVFVLIWVVSGGPAEQAGLKSHDVLLKVDGLPFMDENGNPRTLGPVGSTMTVTVQTPGQTPRDVQVVRQSIGSPPLVDSCLVAGAQVGIIRWSDASNPDTFTQTADSIKALNADKSLRGLIIDTRSSAGYNPSNFPMLLSLFTSGELGSFIAPRGDSDPNLFQVNSPLNIFGSQELPLVFLQDQATPSPLATMITGLLQVKGRARIVGQTAPGSLFSFYIENFADGSAVYLANKVFQPTGKTADYWHKSGVVPDAVVTGLWNQFTEANDPYIARAVDLLIH